MRVCLPPLHASKTFKEKEGEGGETYWDGKKENPVDFTKNEIKDILGKHDLFYPTYSV